MNPRERAPASSRFEPRIPPIVALVVVLLAVLACAPKAYVMVDDPPPSEDLRSILLVPLNFDYVPSNAWVDGLGGIQATMVSKLAESGRTVETITLRDAIDTWREAARSVGGITGSDGRKDPVRYEAAREALVRSLAHSLAEEGRSVDVVVLPSVVVRTASVKSRRVEWDDAYAKLRVDVGERIYDRHIPSGMVRATSLRISVFAPDGRMLFERYRGLEVMQYVYVEKNQFWTPDREDLFEDPAIWEEAIPEAFAPLIALAASEK